MRRALILVMAWSLVLGACSGDGADVAVSTATSVASPRPTTAEAVTEETNAVTPTTPVEATTTTTRPLPRATGAHPFDWSSRDVKSLDGWGDSPSAATDLIAVYERHDSESVTVRVDLLDFRSDSAPDVLVGIDFTEGGTTRLAADGASVFQLEWNLLVGVVGGEPVMYDPSFADLSDRVLAIDVDHRLDLVMIEIPVATLAGWDGSMFRLQPIVVDPVSGVVADSGDVVSTDDATGQAKLVVHGGNAMIPGEPSAVSWYDGFGLRPDDRPGERRGFRYLLDAVERYEVPLTWWDLRIDLFPTNEYLRINDRLRRLADEGLFAPLVAPGYGHMMPWQPDDVDVTALRVAADLWDEFGFPLGTVAFPYEALLTTGDIEVLRAAGVEAVFGMNQYRYWTGWIEDWNDSVAVQADIESLRKIHLIDGMPFVFTTRDGNYAGFVADDRWETIDWSEYSEYDQYLGTDEGLDLWWRRILHDMARDPDQEQFWEIGTDFMLTPWVFPDVADWNLAWIAAHPWIEPTTFASIAGRGWEPIDDGDLGLDPGDLLIQYPLNEDDHYNAYFPQHYYGGVSDGHSPLVPAGDEIESYYDYVPFLAEGRRIPSGRIMGDDATPGSIVAETLGALRAAPDNNDLTRLAWLSYLLLIGEQTFHGRPDGSAALEEGSKIQANLMGQVNKLVAAAGWADVASGLPSESVLIVDDLDLDGEDEYVLFNDRVYAVFENDGGRLEYGFAYDPDYGPVQVVAPAAQYSFGLSPPVGFEDGEAALPITWPTIVDGAFVDDVERDGAYDYGEFEPSVSGESVTFTRGDYSKTYTLDGDSIVAAYSGPSDARLDIGVSVVTNMAEMFTSSWPDRFELIDEPDGVGWRNRLAGAAIFTTDESWIPNVTSFADSPARDEMRERDDQATYLPGHWTPFPRGWIGVNDTAYGRFVLTLRADPAIP